jgi:hypothetical protein
MRFIRQVDINSLSVQTVLELAIWAAGAIGLTKLSSSTVAEPSSGQARITQEMQSSSQADT